MAAVTKRELTESAADWVETVGRRLPHFIGALLHGSILERSDDEPLSPFSDVDLIVLLDDAGPPAKPGKLRYRGALLDVTYLSWTSVQEPERVLAHYHLAPSFARPEILSDPTGQLERLHRAVAPAYTDRHWVWKRVLHARENALEKLKTLEKPAPIYDRVMAWAFAAGILCHIILVAALQNPTVRKRYAAVKRVLEAHGRQDVYQELLRLLGCHAISPGQVARHLDRMAAAFDVAQGVAKTPLPFSADISPLARPVSVDGSREMIERGEHREAVFWIVATYCRCLKILEADAPAELENHLGGFHELLSHLGVDGPQKLERRAAAVKEALPRMMEVAEILANAG